MAGHPFLIIPVVIFPNMGFMERAVHLELDRFRVRGGAGVEWFKCDLNTICSKILTRLPTYLGQLGAEGGGHGIQGAQGHPVAGSGPPDASVLCRSPLGGDGVLVADDMSAPGSLAANWPGGPRQVVPDGRQLPIFGKVPVGILAVGQEAAGDSGNDGTPWEKPGAYVLKGPAPGVEVMDDLERFRYQPV